MKLYELPRGTHFSIADTRVAIPPDSEEPDLISVYKLVKIDGMYSICKDESDNTFYLAAFTEVDPVTETQGDSND